MYKEEWAWVCLSGKVTTIYIPKYANLSKEDVKKFINYEKNNILNDCIAHPERYLAGV